MHNFDPGGGQVKASYLAGCSVGLIHHPLLLSLAEMCSSTYLRAGLFRAARMLVANAEYAERGLDAE